MEYEVSNSHGETAISKAGSPVKVIVRVAEDEQSKAGTTFGLATLYQVRGGFVPVKTYVFHTLPEVSPGELKRVMDFFFLTILETELYVKEIPRTSFLFEQEAERLYGKGVVEEEHKAVGVIRQEK